MHSKNRKCSTHSRYNERKMFKMVEQYRVKTYNWASTMKWPNPSGRWKKYEIDFFKKKNWNA